MADKKRYRPGTPSRKRPAARKAPAKKAKARKPAAGKRGALKRAVKKPPAKKRTASKPGSGRLTIQDLARIRKDTRATLAIRSGQGRAKVTVHMGTCGIAAGARDIMHALLNELRKKRASEVIVTTSGCAGLCSREPMATVEVRKQPPVKYVSLTPQKMRKIVVDHVLGGRPVAEYALAVGSETMY